MTKLTEKQASMIARIVARPIYASDKLTPGEKTTLRSLHKKGIVAQDPHGSDVAWDMTQEGHDVYEKMIYGDLVRKPEPSPDAPQDEAVAAEPNPFDEVEFAPVYTPEPVPPAPPAPVCGAAPKPFVPFIERVEQAEKRAKAKWLTIDHCRNAEAGTNWTVQIFDNPGMMANKGWDFHDFRTFDEAEAFVDSFTREPEPEPPAPKPDDKPVTFAGEPKAERYCGYCMKRTTDAHFVKGGLCVVQAEISRAHGKSAQKMINTGRSW